MKKIKPNKVTFYKFNQSKTEYVYVLKYERVSLWKRIIHKIFEFPPHYDIWFEKIIVIYEE